MSATASSIDLVTLGLACADVMVRPFEGIPDRGRMKLVPHLELHLGGLAAVTATVFAQLGGRAAFIGAVGHDGFGGYVLNAMASQGVDVSRVRSRDDAATASTVVLISADGERTFLHHAGATDTVTAADVDLDFVARARVLHWGGPSAMSGLDGEPVAGILSEARRRGVITSMDTCYDGRGLWFEYIRRALPHLDIVMSSFDEACHYTGQHTPQDIAAFYLDHGASTVMVKLGAGGVYLRQGPETLHLPAWQVPVVDTTGAGDAACAGFLYGYVRGWGLAECGRLANAVGALTVSAMGGAEAIHSLEQVQHFIADTPTAQNPPQAEGPDGATRSPATEESRA